MDPQLAEDIYVLDRCIECGCCIAGCGTVRIRPDFVGGVGINKIARFRFGYVVDMIGTDFMEFPVFNVADCFITCSCILLLAHLFLFNKDFWKEEKKK